MLTKEQVKKISTLSGLKFDDNTSDKFTSQLSNIMDMISEVTKLNCDDVEPLRSVCDMNQRMVEDEVKKINTRDDILSNVPTEQKEMAQNLKYFIVPKVIE
ncbi:MAG: Asp-tRNA(Asn)/Glu-tRNA(Gln) amidotransferase subunit GatC [Rickettsiaceae bacterium]